MNASLTRSGNIEVERQTTNFHKSPLRPRVRSEGFVPENELREICLLEKKLVIYKTL